MVAVSVAKSLIAERVDEFQIKMLETISEIKALAREDQAEGDEKPNFGGADMYFT